MVSRLVVQMQTSVDGFVAATDPGTRWQLWDWGDDWTWDDALRKEFNATAGAAGVILLSRPMLEEGYLDHWGRVADAHPDDPDYDFARRIVASSKVVATSRSVANRWERTTVITGDLAETVRELKTTQERDILTFGGTRFASRLLSLGLVDELQLYVNPTALGAGNSLYSPAGRATGLELLDARPYECGMVVIRYAPRCGSFQAGGHGVADSYLLTSGGLEPLP